VLGLSVGAIIHLVPKKGTIFEMVTLLTESDFPSQKTFLVGKNNIFLLFKITQVFVLPLRAVVAVIALVCARTCMRTYKSCTCVERSWSFSLSTFYYVFFYSFEGTPRLLFLSYLTEKVKQKQIDHKKSDKQIDQKKKQNAISNIFTPNIKQVVYLSISISTAIYAIRSVPLLYQQIVSEQKRKQEDVKVDKESKTVNDKKKF